MSTNTAETWYHLTELRERQHKQTLARVQADMLRARERVAAAREAREAELHEVREQLLSGPVQVAALRLVSEALAAGEARVEAAARSAEALERPLSEARETLAMSARDRKIAEKWLERRRARERQERQRKLDRMEGDYAARLAAQS